MGHADLRRIELLVVIFWDFNLQHDYVNKNDLLALLEQIHACYVEDL